MVGLGAIYAQFGLSYQRHTFFTPEQGLTFAFLAYCYPRDMELLV